MILTQSIPMPELKPPEVKLCISVVPAPCMLPANATRAHLLLSPGLGYQERPWLIKRQLWAQMNRSKAEYRPEPGGWPQKLRRRECLWEPRPGQGRGTWLRGL